MAVRTHAQHQHVGAAVMRGCRAYCAFGLQIGRIVFNQGNPPCGGGAVLQQVLPHQRGIAVGVAGRDDALVRQRNAHLAPIQIRLRQGVEKGNGRTSARHSQYRLAALFERSAQILRHRFRQGPGGLLRGREGMESYGHGCSLCDGSGRLKTGFPAKQKHYD